MRKCGTKVTVYRRKKEKESEEGMEVEENAVKQ